jgi:hypothetical protein
MSRRLIPLAVLIAAFAARASAQDVEALKEKKAAKLAEAWVTKNPWITDWEKAKETSAETGKPIFAYFTRSYQP